LVEPFWPQGLICCATAFWTEVYAMIALLILLAAQVAAPAAASPPPKSPVCDTSAHHAFDFWIGDWDVSPNGHDLVLVAHSRIEKLYAGCAVRENWMPLKGAGGGSLNSVNPETGRWHQTWIGSQPGRVEFEGGPAGGKMVLTGFWRGVNGPGQDGLIRMSYTAINLDTVRQHGEISTDQGLTWSDNFDFIYRRSASKR
jgi:hypothetical protein